jgi:RNA polymerase sigma-70 factor (ECF subfamily)
MADDSTTALQGLIDRLNAGDPTAVNALIGRACDRLRRLTHTVFRDFGRLHRLEDTDDVLNAAVLRLLRRLQSDNKPDTVREFFRRAGREVRCALLDLTKHYFGPEGPAVREVRAETPSSAGAEISPENVTSTFDPGRLAQWTEFHRLVEGLPDEEREAFELLWYQGLTQDEAAHLLGVSEATVKRRWTAARLRLGAALRPADPDAPSP